MESLLKFVETLGFRKEEFFYSVDESETLCSVSIL